ncbi:choline/ethanolamine kinase [Neocloeon triangulifer]|uniref:choline/ethanolamine kinase n=1 Tax=Neocloeon triangulifer TaxID=2078957 RepID=UPI00286ED989|nr:choline/ethanolamine kinase [Neocloeon triangulifer]
MDNDNQQQKHEEVQQRAFLLCKEYLHGVWNSISQNDMHIKKISGGLSNLLYLCSLPAEVSPSGNEPSCVLLRLYGQVRGETEEALAGLLTEAVIFTLLSEKQRGPRLLGVFPGGRLEEYIPARPLLTRELQDSRLSGMIAAKLAQIHAMDVPINKHPHWLWNTMNRWLENILEMKPSLTKPAEAAMLSDFLACDLEQEMRWLKRELEDVESPAVFCHNDLQEGNILLRELDQEVVVIDFEYSAYNYRGFDIANHMCEWVFDYTCPHPPYFTANHQNYPSLQQQQFFARKYLEALPESEGSCTDEEVEQLLTEARIFTLASHFFWALWSVVNGAVSTIPFDYWVYGKARFEAYYKHKHHLINTQQVNP